jgi:hypothetical protein
MITAHMDIIIVSFEQRLIVLRCWLFPARSSLPEGLLWQASFKVLVVALLVTL